MPRVAGQTVVAVNNYINVFSGTVQPMYANTDFIWLYGDARFVANADIQFNPYARCAHPRLVYPMYNNFLLAPNVSPPDSYNQNTGSISWNLDYYGACNFQMATMLPSQTVEIQAGNSDKPGQTPMSILHLSTNFGGGDSPVPCQGFVCYYNLTVMQNDATAGTPTTLEVNFNLGNLAGPSSIVYTIEIQINGNINIYRQDAQTPKKKLDTISADTENTDIFQPTKVSDLNSIHVLLIGGIIHIGVGSLLNPWTRREWTQLSSRSPNTPPGNDFAWTINAFTVFAGNFDAFRFSLHPIKFLQQVAPTPSEEITLGFTPLNLPTFWIHYAPNTEWSFWKDNSNKTTGFTPPGCYATATYDANLSYGSVLVYDLSFHGPPSNDTPSPVWNGDPYSDYAAAVSAVTFQFDSLSYSYPSTEKYLLPLSVDVHWSFDFESLSIRSNAVITLQNFYGFFSQLVDQTGHIACRIQLGSLLPDLGVQGNLATLFTGVGNTSFEEINGPGGQSVIHMHCEDRWVALETPTFALPWMDGWNIYYAIAYIAQLGGIPIEQMAFAQFVPDNPYDVTPNDYWGGNTYFLPIGVAGTSVSRFPDGTTKADIIRKLAKIVGAITYFDQYGYFHFEKFIPPSPVPIRVFSDYGTPDLNEMHNQMVYSGTLSETRNSVVVIGIDGFGTWQPIVAHAADPNMWDPTALNFKGFVDPFVWVDSQFADLNFATAAADLMLAYLRWPARYIEFDAYMPLEGFLKPLDVIAIWCPRSGAHLKPFIVYDISYHFDITDAPKMHVKGRWFFPG